MTSLRVSRPRLVGLLLAAALLSTAIPTATSCASGVAPAGSTGPRTTTPPSLTG